MAFKLNRAGLNQVLSGARSPGGIAVTQAADVVAPLAKRFMGHKTNALDRSVSTRVVQRNGKAVAEVTAGGRSAPYGLLHHTGTRPHPIFPRNKSVLRFDVGGVTVFAKSVNHPGTDPNPYLIRAARAAGLPVREGGS